MYYYLLSYQLPSVYVDRTSNVLGSTKLQKAVF